jgi:hypothetical protein
MANIESRVIEQLLEQVDTLKKDGDAGEKEAMEKKIKQLEGTVKKQQGYIRTCCKGASHLFL